MKKLMHVVMLAVALLFGAAICSAAPRFVEVSDHCYYLQLEESRDNVAAVVTADGILLINPPQLPDLSVVLEALKEVSSKTVRWVVFTEPSFSRNAGASFPSDLKPVMLTCIRQKNLAQGPAPTVDAKIGSSSSEWLIFERQMSLFPSDLEIRIFSVQHRARSGGDIVVFVPSEKVLLVGALYEAARYPDINAALDGTAIGWFDGMKQVIDAVPILKPAIPQVKSDPKADKDKRLEEFITVVSSRGEPSNLQNMKDLLESAQKLRSDIARIIKRGRGCEDFLASSGANAYRSYANLDAFAAQLCAETK
ncbi:MAG: hypothetical protein QUT30_05575 [Acidobacteriota bacterium]|nr:hypothetical protein [Acidobacteriota bacterium]